MTFVQITPAFPPEISGVGDYSAILHQALVKTPSFETLVTHEVSGLSQSHVTCLTGQNSSHELASALGTAHQVLLHFSGYGYAPQGLCHWLVNGLRSWKNASIGRRVVTLFHEVYASGPIWRRSFWTAGAQRRIAAELVQLSDSIFVTSEVGHQQLISISLTPCAEIIPVFSTIGELQNVRPLEQRSSTAVVFGSAGRRQHVYQAATKQAELLNRTLSHLGIKEIIDIGPGFVAPHLLAGVPIRILGILPASAISMLLGDCQVGLIYSPGELMTKSSVASSYFSHGLLVLNTGNIDKLPRDLVVDRDFIAPDSLGEDSRNIQDIASAGLAWYCNHGIERTVQRLLSPETRY